MSKVEVVDSGDAEFFNNWLAEKFHTHGLVGLVQTKGLDCSYSELRRSLDAAGVKHGLPQVHPRGLGKHIDRVFEMACEGCTAQEIAAALGAEVKTVQRFCNRHHIELPRKLLLVDLEGDILEMAERGMSVPDIADELGFSTTAIREFLKARGMKAQNPYHKGHIVTYNGYKMVKAPGGHPYADSKGYVREHRLVVEQKLGRYLEPHEVVHHKDGNKMNNDPDNLELTTLSEHTGEHARAGETGWAVYHAKRRMI